MEWHRKMDLQKQNQPESNNMELEPEKTEDLQEEIEDNEFEDNFEDDSTIEDYLDEDDKTPLSPMVEQKSVPVVKPQPLVSNEPKETAPTDPDYSEPDFLSQILINTDLDHPEVYP